jgi:DNA replication protein DnaC
LAKVAKRASEDVFGGEFVDAFSLSVARAQAHLGEEPPILTRTLAASVLVVDDLGAEKDIHGSAVAEVIHERHANMRVTIITSGFSLQQLGARYGDGIGRRLGEGARIIDLGAK